MDSGKIWNKDDLPVTRLDIGGLKGRKRAQYSVGPLQCAATQFGETSLKFNIMYVGYIRILIIPCLNTEFTKGTNTVTNHIYETLQTSLEIAVKLMRRTLSVER